VSQETASFRLIVVSPDIVVPSVTSVTGREIRKHSLECKFFRDLQDGFGNYRDFWLLC